MAIHAQKHQQQSPAYQTPPLSHARKTTPLNRHAITEDTQFMARELCYACQGTGDEPLQVVDCPVCHRRYTRHDLKEYGKQIFRQILLPCKHALGTRDINFYHPACEVCKHSPVGRGYLIRWATIRELFDLITETFGVPDDVTGEMRALHHQDAFARSGEPTVTAPPQSPLYRPGGTITPNLGTNILEFDSRAVSPHLPPVSPENDRSF